MACHGALWMWIEMAYEGMGGGDVNG